MILLNQGAFDLLAQNRYVEEVLNANANAVDLVGVGRANAATGGADGALAQKALGGLVDGHVIRRDDVGVGRYAQARGVDSAGVQFVDFVKQNL